MDFVKVLPVLLVVFLAGCTTQVSNDNAPQEQIPPEQPYATPAAQAPPQTPPVGQGILQGEVVTVSQSSTQEFTLETDDSGYYNGTQKVDSISVTKNNMVKITFNLRTAGIYPAGGEYRGCGTQSPSAAPGGTTSMQFNASSTCTITAYWPSTGVAKASLQAIVS